MCGGRLYGATVDERQRLFNALANLNPAVVIHGGATGADTLAGRWAAERGIPVALYRADWRTHGRAAGAIRNAYMLTHGRPDHVLAAPGGTGTRDMVRRAQAAGLTVEFVHGTVNRVT